MSGTQEQPRLAVFRSNRSIGLQLINDVEGKTLVSVSAKEVGKAGNKTGQAEKAGRLLAEKALKLGIQRAVFDRGSYKYHGRIKAAAEGARAGGLKF